MTVSERKRITARANGSKSRGPITLAGKSRSSQNAIKHGLLSKGMSLPSEHAEAFDDLNRDLTEELQPTTASELIIARSFAMCALRLARLYDLEATAQREEIFKLTGLSGVEATLAAWRNLHANDPSFPLYRRYEATLTRELHRAHRRFLEVKENVAEPNEPTAESTPGFSEGSDTQAALFPEC